MSAVPDLTFQAFAFSGCLIALIQCACVPVLVALALFRHLLVSIGHRDVHADDGL